MVKIPPYLIIHIILSKVENCSEPFQSWKESLSEYASSRKWTPVVANLVGEIGSFPGVKTAQTKSAIFLACKEPLWVYLCLKNPAWPCYMLVFLNFRSSLMNRLVSPKCRRSALGFTWRVNGLNWTPGSHRSSNHCFSKRWQLRVCLIAGGPDLT